MRDVTDLIRVLEVSVAKHGEKPLTTAYLLNILNLVDQQQRRKDEVAEQRIINLDNVMDPNT